MKGFWRLITLFMCIGLISWVSDGSNYEWKQVLPFGNGSFPTEWKPGTFPLGIKPMIAFNDELWMTGQKFAWSEAH